MKSMNPENMKGYFRKSILPNGIRILTERVPNVRSLSVGIWVCAGSRDEEQENSGISHFIEHMIFKGTKRRSALDIAKAFDRMGGLSNAFTSKETTCFHAKVLDSHQPVVLDLLSDIFLNSRFEPPEVDRERHVIIQEISMVEDSPDDLIHDLFCSRFWPDNGLGRSILGTFDTVEAITPESIRDYMKRTYTGPNILVSAAGNIKHEAFVDGVAALFKDVPAGKPSIKRCTPASASGIRFYKRDLEQAHILLGYDGPSVSSGARYAAMLLNVILGGSMSSRLFQEVREKRGLAYSVYSYLTPYHDTGMLGIYAGVAPRNVAAVTEIMQQELARLAHAALGPSEIDAARDHAKGGLLLSAENTDTHMTRLAKNEINLGRYVSYDEVVASLDAVTPDDIQAVASECLNNNCLKVYLGPIPDSEINRCEQLSAPGG